MSNQKTTHIWSLVIVFVLLGINSCTTNFMIVYDQYFQQQLKNVSLQDNQTRLDLIQISKQYDNLQNITAIIKNITKDVVILLFTEQDDFIENILSGQQQVLKYGISLANMIKGNSKMQNSFCLSLNQKLKRTLTMLIYRLSLPRVAVITDEEDCAKEFYESLRALISTSHPTEIHVKTSHVVYRMDQRSHQSVKSLKQPSLLDVNVIILIIPDQYIPMILRETHNNVLMHTHSRTQWIIPSYYEKAMQLNWFPQNLLSFKILEDKYFTDPYKELDKRVPQIIQIYQTFSNFGPRDNLSMLMYQSLQRMEEENIETIKLSLRYRNSGKGSPRDWQNVPAEIMQEVFYIEENVIPVLNPVVDSKIDLVRIVTILEEPYELEDKKLYDNILNNCIVGLKCQKPIIKNGKLNYETSCCIGVLIELLTLVIKYTGIKVNLYIVEDGQYGGIGKNGTWNGMIGDLVKGKADMAIGPITPTESRSKVVNFSTAYADGRIGIILMPNFAKFNFFTFQYITLISINLHIILWLVLIAVMVTHFILENCVYFTGLIKNVKCIKRKYYSAYESMTYIGGVTLQRDLGGICPKRLGARMISIVFAFGMFIFVTTYTAVLAAKKMEYIEDNPFKGSKDERMRNPTSEYRFATVKNTNFESYFKNNENLHIRKLFDFMEPYNVDTPEEGIKKIINGDLEALIYDYKFLYWYVARNHLCELKVQLDTIIETSNAFAMKKDFKFSDSVNKAIFHYRETPVIPHIYATWFTNICQTLSKSPKLRRLNIKAFGGLILMLFGTAVLCASMLLPEHLLLRFFENKLKRKLITKFHTKAKNEENL